MCEILAVVCLRWSACGLLLRWRGRSLDHLFIAAAAAAAAADPAQRAAETGATDPAGQTTRRVSLLVRDLLLRRRSAPSARLELILTRPGPVRSAGLV